MTHKKLVSWLAAAAAGAVLIVVAPSGSAASAPAPAPMDRTVLPIAEPEYPHITELDVRNATPPPRFEVKAPEGAPNVLLVLIDDMGFGVPSPFGGPVHMPTADRLARSTPGPATSPRAPRPAHPATSRVIRRRRRRC